MPSNRRLSADNFRAELAALTLSLRRSIEADCAAFPVDAAASAARAARVREDFPFFRRTYFPHYTSRKDGTPTGDSLLHEWLDVALPAAVDAPGGVKLACAAPRGEAKTTFVDVFFLLWCVVTGRTGQTSPSWTILRTTRTSAPRSSATSWKAGFCARCSPSGRPTTAWTWSISAPSSTMTACSPAP